MTVPLYAGVELGGTKCICVLARSHNEVLDKKVIDTTEPHDTICANERTMVYRREGEAIRSMRIASIGPVS